MCYDYKRNASTRSLMDRTKASDAFNAGSSPVGCIYITLDTEAKIKRKVSYESIQSEQIAFVERKIHVHG